eukprot:2034934-Prymnesium_polylepis.1
MKGCRMCMALKHSVNTGRLVRSLLPDLVVVHVAFDGVDLETGPESRPVESVLGNATRATYFPAAYFFSPGGERELGVPGPDPEDTGFTRAFRDDEELSAAMRTALRLVGTPPSLWHDHLRYLPPVPFKKG